MSLEALSPAELGPADKVRLNPPGDQLGRRNAVMGRIGRAQRVVDDFAGPLSIKFMVRGAGTWRVAGNVYHVEEGVFLVLNDRQTYSLAFESDAARESFCPCFRRGFVEDVARALTRPDTELLDNPEPSGRALTFREQLHSSDRRVVPALLHLRRLMQAGDAEGQDIEAGFLRLAEALLAHARIDVRAQIDAVPAARKSTRLECYRRVARGRDYMHAYADRPLRLDDIAAHAHLSPYHFHRLFKAASGRTPQQYLRELRLARARRLLSEPQMPITQVALAAGFESAAAFSTRFTRSLGISPSRYRAAKLRKNDKAGDA